MKNKMKNKIILVAIVALVCSCVSNTDSKFLVNFGKEEFKEPFVGLLKSKPEFLRKTLDWPVFKSLKSDTVALTKYFDVEFNEESLRSESKAIIFFTDTLGCPLSSLIQIYYNDSLLSDNHCVISASEKEMAIKITLKLHPDIGEHTCIGHMRILGYELDEVNTMSLNTYQQTLGTWECSQEIGWPILIWLLWLLMLLLIILVIAVLIYLLVKYVIIPLSTLFSNIPKVSIVGAKATKPSTMYTNKDAKKEEKKVDEEGDLDPYIKEALCLEDMLIDTIYGIAKKNDILERLSKHLAKTFYTNRELNERCYQALQKNTQHALDKFNSFLPEPDFSSATWPNCIVDVSDLYAQYSCAQLKRRGGSKGSFQYLAQMRIAKQIDPELRKWWKQNRTSEEYDHENAFWAWRDAHDLVPHEDANCRTLRLVKRDIHKALKHAGGIAHAILIKKYFMPC